jgi:hypothetical protein
LGFGVWVCSIFRFKFFSSPISFALLFITHIYIKKTPCHVLSIQSTFIFTFFVIWINNPKLEQGFISSNLSSSWTYNHPQENESILVLKSTKKMKIFYDLALFLWPPRTRYLNMVTFLINLFWHSSSFHLQIVDVQSLQAPFPLLPMEEDTWNFSTIQLINTLEIQVFAY